MRRERGFSYIGLLILLAILGAASAKTIELASTVAQRSKEAELQAQGDELSRAFKRYYEASPKGAPAYPRELRQLLQDPRFPNTVRHLRRIPRNPLTGRTDWAPIPAPGGGIMGVAVIATGEPMRKPLRTLSTAVAGAEAAGKAGASQAAPAVMATGYAAWRFGFDPAQAAADASKAASAPQTPSGSAAPTAP
jgi:type II secretory pathway pseudopilin PulG